MKYLIKGFVDFLKDRLTKVLILVEIIAFFMYVSGLFSFGSAFDSFISLFCIPFCLLFSALFNGYLMHLSNKCGYGGMVDTRD